MNPSDLPAWRRWSGYVVIAALAAVLVWQTQGAQGIAAPSADVSSPTPVAAPSTGESGAVTPSSTVGTEVPSSEAVDIDLTGVVADALAAWGRFAGSGDLSEVEPYFWPDGPQWANLEADAQKIVAAPGREWLVVLTEAERSGGGVGDHRGEVVGTVTFRRNGENDQVFRWSFTLTAVDGQWRIWSVSPAE